MTLWRAAEAAAATGGRPGADWAATGVSIDTRSLQPGDLFFALKDVRDGHDFVAQALERGAAAALVSRLPEGVDPARCLLVDEVLPALERLAVAARARLADRAKVIAITGSVGKTTAKEMLRQALAGQGRIHAAEASYNNHWGVPLTLARMPADTDFAVIEIGMNAPGEIAPLAKLARPHVALITTIAPAHLEAFGVIEGIAREKASIFEGLEPHGIAVAPSDVETAPILFEAARARAGRLIRFGEAEASEYRIVQIRVSDRATIVELDVCGERRLVKLAVAGRHLAGNAAAILAAAEAAGADPARASMALGTWAPVDGRGVREMLRLGPGEEMVFELIDDAFNANPTSLAAGLDVLAAATPARGGRRVAVLGDMLELGPEAAAMHTDLADLGAMAVVDLVHTCGPLMAHLRAALPGAKRGQHAEQAEDLARAVPRDLRPGDVVLVKGSKGSRVSRVVDALRKLGQSAQQRG